MPITLPAAWLNPLPPEYKIPVWRWILLPATALLLWKSKGVWINGNLTLDADNLHFLQKGFLKSKRPAEWRIPLGRIEAVHVKKGLASETIEVTCNGVTTKIMSMKTEDFVAALQSAVSNAGSSR